MTRWCALALIAAFAASAIAAAELGDGTPPPPLPKDLTELTARLEQILKDSRTPGMALAIVDRQGVVYAGGLGLADVASGRKADADTMFRIGSTSKAFTAFAAVKLAREGKLDLNARLKDLAPEIAFENPWEATDPVRIVHLLEHTSGFDDIHLRDYAHEDPSPDSLAGALAFDPDSRVSRWRPGTRMAYCNSGPAIVAYVIEKITGERFEDHVAREIFTPIGMPRTSYFLTEEVKRTQATLYRPDGVTPYAYWHIALRPAGSVNSSAREMAEYVRFHLNRGTVGPAEAPVALFSAAEFERIETPTTNLAAAEGMTAGYGLYNYSSFDERGFLWRGHNGGVLGGASDFSYLPEAGVGYSILVNATTEKGFPEISKLVRAYLTQHLPAPKDAAPPEGRVPEALAAEFDGYYLPVNPRVALVAPLERIFGVASLRIEDGAFRFGDALSADKKRLVAMPDDPRVLRRDDRAVPSIILLESTELGAPGLVVNNVGATTFVRVPALVAHAPFALFALAGVLALAQCLFLLVWGVRALFRRLAIRPHLELRLWPLASSLLLFGFIVSIGLVFVDEDLFAHYGAVTMRSLTVAVASLAALLVAWWGLYRSLQAVHISAHRGLRGFALTTLGVNALLMAYLAMLGMVPFITWN